MLYTHHLSLDTVNSLPQVSIDDFVSDIYDSEMLRSFERRLRKNKDGEYIWARTKLFPCEKSFTSAILTMPNGAKALYGSPFKSHQPTGDTHATFVPIFPAVRGRLRDLEALKLLTITSVEIYVALMSYCRGGSADESIDGYIAIDGGISLDAAYNASPIFANFTFESCAAKRVTMNDVVNMFHIGEIDWHALVWGADHHARREELSYHARCFVQNLCAEQRVQISQAFHQAVRARLKTVLKLEAQNDPLVQDIINLRSAKQTSALVDVILELRREREVLGVLLAGIEKGSITKASISAYGKLRKVKRKPTIDLLRKHVQIK